MARVMATMSLCLVLGCATAMTPRANTREEIKAYVDRASAIVQREGATACHTLSQPEWYSGDSYVFVFELDGPVVCHPAQPALVGRMERDVKDPAGKPIGEEFTRLAGADGAGWVDYVWARPGEVQPVAKSTYVRAVTGPDGKTYVIGSGGYELP